MRMKPEDVIQEIEYLAGQLGRLWEAEDLSAEISPRMSKQIQTLNREMLHRLKELCGEVSRAIKVSLGASTPPRYSIEQLERWFLTLRNAAETAQARAAKTDDDDALQVSLTIAKWTRQAAYALKARAEERGVWTPQYRDEHGLGNWL